MKSDSEKYQESIEQIWHLRANEQKQAFKQDAHFKHLFEFESWIMEQRAIVQQLYADSLTNKAVLPRLEKASTYLNNMIKAFNYSCQNFVNANYADSKNNELNLQIIEAASKIKHLESELKKLNDLNNF